MSAPPHSAALRAQPLAVLGQVARSEGVPALYVGVLPALMAMALSGAVYYSLYDTLKSRHLSVVARRTGASPEPRGEPAPPVSAKRGQLGVLNLQGTQGSGYSGIRPSNAPPWHRPATSGMLVCSSVHQFSLSCNSPVYA